MLKMIVTFKDGISVKDLPELQEIIESFGGIAVFVTQENNETNNKNITPALIPAPPLISHQLNGVVNRLRKRD